MAGIWRLIYKVATQFCGFSMAQVGEANRRLGQIWNCWALLYYLAVTGRPHTRAELAGLFWADMPETGAAMNLRRALHNLNQLVGDHLSVTRSTVAFNFEAAHWLDVADFQNHLADSALTPDPGPLRAAVALYGGDFLQGFFVREAAAFEDWQLLERERLKAAAINA